MTWESETSFNCRDSRLGNKSEICFLIKVKDKLTQRNVFYSPIFKQKLRVFNCGITSTCYNCICITVLMTLKMATTTAETCW